MNKKKIQELIRTEIESQIKVLLQNEIEKIRKALKQEIKPNNSILNIKEDLIDISKFPKNPFEIFA